MQKIGLISDVHAYPAAVQQALEIFDREQVDEILCAGDIAGYFDDLIPTIDLLQQYRCKTIIGNHDQSYLQQYAKSAPQQARDFLEKLADFYQLKLGQKQLYMVHAAPPNSQHGGIKLLDQDGAFIPSSITHWKNELANFPYDILIVGHTHQVFVKQLGKVLVINPGSTVFNHSCMILNVADQSLQTFALEQKEIVASWNFSHLFSGHEEYPVKN